MFFPGHSRRVYLPANQSTSYRFFYHRSKFHYRLLGFRLILLIVCFVALSGRHNFGVDRILAKPALILLFHPDILHCVQNDNSRTVTLSETKGIGEELFVTQSIISTLTQAAA